MEGGYPWFGRQVSVLAWIQHRTYVPQLDGLVFAVADEVAAVALRVQVGYTLGVTHHNAHRLPVPHGTSIPDLKEDQTTLDLPALSAGQSCIQQRTVTYG